MLKVRSTRRAIPRIERSSSPSHHPSTKLASFSCFRCTKQLATFIFIIWSLLFALYIIYVFRASNPLSPLSPDNHDPLAIANRAQLLNTHSQPSPANQALTTRTVDNPGYGHPSMQHMPNPCIVILTYNRPNQLSQTIQSLQSIEGVTSYQIYISQDGDNKATSNMIRDSIAAIPYHQQSPSAQQRSIKHIQHAQAKHVFDPTAKLAIHYKYMFSIIFEELNHSHAIILEDDMVFSADFLEYFAATVPLLNDERNALFCISSWNDYGQNFLTHDEQQLFRTDYFPGLGWMLKQSLWMEIRPIFPEDHWDHFMRIDTVSKGRDCIYPDVSRNYNVGEYGSTMDQHWYNQYLRPMQFHKESHVAFRELDLSYLQKEIYEQNLVQMIRDQAKFVGVFPRDSSRIYQQLNSPESDKYGHVLLIAYHAYHWAAIANRIGVLETQRTRHKHVIVIRQHGVTYIFANVRLCPYLEYNEEAKAVLLEMNLKNKDLVIVTGEVGSSCHSACRKQKKQCLEDHFEYVNSCSVLQQYFQCEGGCLGGVVGEDVPNYVARNKPGMYQKCLTSEFAPNCGASHPTTARICPCA